jgi:hypothetical protein
VGNASSFWLFFAALREQRNQSETARAFTAACSASTTRGEFAVAAPQTLFHSGCAADNGMT